MDTEEPFRKAAGCEGLRKCRWGATMPPRHNKWGTMLRLSKSCKIFKRLNLQGNTIRSIALLASCSELLGLLLGENMRSDVSTLIGLRN